MAAESKILLETGTNELEILEFLVNGISYGINVAKITELMKAMPIQPLPLSHDCVEGVIKPREIVYTIIDLAKYLGHPASSNPETDIFMITSFNKTSLAFHVHAVDGIHRISWENIEKPDNVVYGGGEGVVTGIAKVDGRIIAILDFEKITYDISPETGIQPETIAEIAGADTYRADKFIVVAEDSALLRKMLLESLTKAGYTSIVVKPDGLEAWEYLVSLKDKPGGIRSHASCVITDIEMPQMDGHRLTKLIKDDKVLRQIPVVIFSSLIDDKMYKKGLEVGADAQLSKPEIINLVNTVDSLLRSLGRDELSE